MKREKRRLAAIMFTDMVGYAAMMRRNEALSLQLLDHHQKLLRSLFIRFGGQEIKSIGDGFLVEFASALAGARCAIAIQKALCDYNSGTLPERRFQVRIGLHVGEIVERKRDVFGDGVNIASRLEKLAAPGGVCISQQAYDQVFNKLSAAFIPAGTRDLKRGQFAMPVYRIDPPGNNVPVFGEKTDSDPASIAVLPLVNIGPTLKDEYLSDGITEDLINALSRVQGLRVMSRTSAFAYKGKAEDVRKIGLQLNVQTILEGSLRRVGSQLKIAVRLISVTDGFQIWAETYERRLSDILGIQQDVAQRLIGALNLKTPAASTLKLLQPATENLTAYQLYLKGRFHWNRRSSDGMAKAIQYFRKAVKVDPQCALAHAGMADCYSLLAFYGGAPARDTFLKAKAAANKAVTLNPMVAETHTSLAYALMHDWDFKGSEREFLLALRMNPAYAPAHVWNGIFLSVLARHGEATAEAKSATQLEPLSATINAVAGMIFYFARQYGPAARLFRDALEMQPDFVLAHEGLGQLYIQQRAWKKAITHLEQALARTRFGGSLLATVAFAHARAGNRRRAQAILEQLRKLRTRGQLSPVSVAIAHIGLNEFDEAFDCLERACELRSGRLIYLKANPVFDDLRSDKRFESLLGKVGLT